MSFKILCRINPSTTYIFLMSIPNKYLLSKFLSDRVVALFENLLIGCQHRSFEVNLKLMKDLRSKGCCKFYDFFYSSSLGLCVHWLCQADPLGFTRLTLKVIAPKSEISFTSAINFVHHLDVSNLLSHGSLSEY